MATIVRKRLQVQPIRGRGIDRSICFAIGELNDAERKKLRGTIFPATSKVDALRTYRELLKMAQQAVSERTVAEFLDSLDQRSRRPSEWGPQFKDHAAEWLRIRVVGGGASESEIESVESILRLHLLPAFGNLPVSEVGARRIDQYKSAKRRQKHQYGTGLSNKSIANHLGVLSRLLGAAVEYGIITANPITPRMWPKRDRTQEESRRGWWSLQEQGKAIATLETWRESEPLRYLALLTQITVGLRFSELRVLERRDLDFAVPGLWVRRSMARKKLSTTKSRRARFHCIPRGLSEQLRRWTMARPETQLLLPQPDGKPLTNKRLNLWYRKLADEAGIRGITSHGARHGVGSSYAALGAGEALIAELLGHEDSRSSSTYTHVRVDTTQAIVEARWAKLTTGVGD